MMSYHLRFLILYHIEDVNDLFNLCQIDQLSQKISLNQEFWTYYYNKYQFKLPLTHYQTSYDWIKSIIITKQTHEILNYLQLDRFDVTQLYNRITFNNIPVIYYKFLNKHISVSQPFTIKIYFNKKYITYVDWIRICDQKVDQLIYNLLFFNNKYELDYIF
jgi:hypothetical protein